MSLRQATHSVPLTEAGTVERRVGQGQQRYTVHRGETSVTLEGPSLRGVSKKRNRPQPGQPLRLRAVVTELRAAGHKTLRWILLTNLQDSVDQVVQAYLFRWKIERLYFLCKVGFKLEDWYQETGERIARRLALVQLAAMVLYELCAADPDQPVGRLKRRIARLGGWSGLTCTPSVPHRPDARPAAPNSGLPMHSCTPSAQRPSTPGAPKLQILLRPPPSPSLPQGFDHVKGSRQP